MLFSAEFEVLPYSDGAHRAHCVQLVLSACSNLTRTPIRTPPLTLARSLTLDLALALALAVVLTLTRCPRPIPTRRER